MRSSVERNDFQNQLDGVLRGVELVNNLLLNGQLCRIATGAQADEPAHLRAVGVDDNFGCRCFLGRGFSGSLFGRGFGGGFFGRGLSRRLGGGLFGGGSRGGRGRGGATTGRDHHAGHNQQGQDGKQCTTHFSLLDEL
jgi:hypothetical protein